MTEPSVRSGAALVTGGGRRIGRAICLELARAGFDVVIHYRSSGQEAEAVASAVRWLVDAGLVTGQMIAVDGGQHLGWRTPDIVE